jgi:CBS domain-containing protein
MNVGEICSRNVVVAFKNMDIAEAARLMREQHVGSLVVVEETSGGFVPIGMLTDRDIVVAVVATEVDERTIRVGDAMSTDLVTASLDEPIESALRRMRRRGVRRMPVLGPGDTLAGIVAVDDMLDSVVGHLRDLIGCIDNEQAFEARTRH